MAGVADDVMTRPAISGGTGDIINKSRTWLKGEGCSIREGIQTQGFDIYSINEVLMQFILH